MRWDEFSPRGISELGLQISSSDTELSWQLKPNFKGFLKGAALSTNSLGFRDDEWTKSCDIIALGRSITIGEGIEQKKIWSELLQTNISNKLDRPFEVCNMGVSGYSILQEKRLIEVFAAQLQPRIILFPFSLEEWDMFIYEGSNVLKNSWKDKLTAHYFLSQFFFSVFAQKFFQDIFRLWTSADWSQLKKVETSEIKTLQSELPSITETLLANSEKVYFLLLPGSNKISKKAIYKSQSILNSWLLQKNQVQVIDLQSYGRLAAESKIFYGDPHPNERVHQGFAEKVYEKIRENY